jgi:TetR/AcrR family transcriptional regulator, cholesterol catabolism regulator
MEGDLTFGSFKGTMHLAMRDLCRELFRENRATIKVSKEEVAVKNLVKILDAALTLCNKKGFAAMSLRDLSKEAGLSMGALYSYFASKDDLLRLMQSQGRTVVLRVLQSHTEGIDHPRTRLRRAVQAHLYLSEVMQPWFYLSYMETKNFPKDEYRRAVEAELFTEKILIDIVQDGQERGAFKPVNAELLGATIKAMLQDWYLKRGKYAKRRTSVDRYAEFLLDFIESYLLVNHDH